VYYQAAKLCCRITKLWYVNSEKKIFDQEIHKKPFFSTKIPGLRAGLVLIICQEDENKKGHAINHVNNMT